MQKHSFQPDFADKAKCALCRKSYIDAHSPISTCESCTKVGPVVLFGDANNPKAILLCADCTQLEYDAANASVTNISEETAQSRIDEMNARLTNARLIDSGVQYNGDFFNNPTIPTESIRASIYENLELNEQQKKEVFNTFLSERIAHFRDSVFLTVAQVAQTDEYTKRGTYESLRDMASALHKAMREKLAAEDKNYVPPINKPVKPKVKKETLGTYDRLVQMFMTVNGCSKEQAIEAINKGSGGKFGNTKFANDSQGN